MNGHANTVVRDMAPGRSVFTTLGAGSDTGEASSVARSGMARRVEPDRAQRLDDAAEEQRADELKRLYATIADLRERLAAHGETERLGRADVVLLHAMQDPMTCRQISAVTRMPVEHLYARLHRLRAMGHVQTCGRVTCIGLGKGQGEWIWHKTPNAN